MDKKAVELARASLEVTHQELSPGFQELADTLNAELSLRSGQADAQTMAQNSGLLTSFVDLLPRASQPAKFGIRTGFEVHTPQMARAIQSSAVWLRVWSAATEFAGGGPVGFVYPNVDFMVRPYWVLGQQHVTKARKQFLLAPASTSVEHRGDLYYGNYADYNSWSPVHRFVKRTGDQLLVLTATRGQGHRIGALATKYFAPLRQGEEYPATIDHHSPDATVVSMYGRVALHRARTVDGMADDQLAAFEVFSKLNLMATIFQQKQGLDSLYSTYQVS